ncbi:Aquaporin [Thalictrum thalictroides]|uniref:Aquaporin n=1 Tax=Thalictrum thalictroides TaxID=46969 RepID=A0A7J6XEY4_THATH|nr:Aquaporin [Thalictrum thalictroides]
MAGYVGVGDEENQYTSRVQPFGSTTSPRAEELKMKDGMKPVRATFRERLGFEELYSLKVWQASIAELLGTAALVFGIDTIVISSVETETKTPHLVVSVYVSILISILVVATAPVSGGHINPTVTFSAALIGLISFSRAIIYILAQCIGAVLGALALKAVVNSTIENTFSLGGCTLTVVQPGTNPITVGIETSPALWLEIICTFVFLFASVSIAFDERRLKAAGPGTVFIIIGIINGLMVFISSTVTTIKGYTGVGMNPARCLGPAIVRGGHLWDGHWVFWAGPAISEVAFSC